MRARASSGRKQRFFWTAAVLCVLGALGSFGTFAAFTATTANSGDQITSGTVALTDNDSGVAMYSATGQKPGDVTERCLKVTYNGSLDASVRLYASAVGAYGSHIDLTITPGTTSAGYSGCGTFTPDAKGAIYSGTLKAFADTYSTYSRGLPDYPGTQVKWNTGDTVAYRFTLTIRDDFAVGETTSVLTTGAHDFTFEARNGQYANTVLATPGLVTYWRLGETSGTTAADAKGTQPGAYVNGPTLNQPGSQTDANPSVSFDGTDDWVTASNPASLQSASGTLEAWIRTSNAGTNFRGIVDKSSAYGLYLYNNQLATYDFSTPAVRNTGISLADDKWHHVAMTYQSGVTNGTILYIDGVARLTTTITVSSQGSAMGIGGGNPGQRFGGRIDEAAFYNQVLTAGQIQAHYDAR